MAYNTGNPIGSGDPRDLRDNAENLDNAANSDNTTWTDRLGQSRRTMAGIEQDAIAAIQNAGYVGTGTDNAVEDYAAGIEITQYNQIVRDGGEFWRVSGSTALPYTTTGAGLPEGGAFVTVGDAALRQELASSVATGQGALNVSGSVIYVDTIADLQALPTSELVDGQQAQPSGYYASGDGGGGPVRIYKSGAAAGTYVDNGGSVIVPIGGDGSGAWVWEWSGAVNAKWFGAKIDGVTGDYDAIEALRLYNKSIGYNGIEFEDLRTGESFINGSLVFEEPDVLLRGVTGAKYRLDSNGQLIADGNIAPKPLFDFGNNKTTGVFGQYVVENLSVRGGTAVNAFSFTSQTNAPDRGATFTNVSGRSLNSVIHIAAPDEGVTASLATLTVDKCNLSGNDYAIYSEGYCYGLNFTNNQAEQNAVQCIVGAFGGGVNISDNMLEGQNNPITILPALTGNTLQYTFQRNYIEGVGGSNLQKLSTVSTPEYPAYLQLGPNYFRNNTFANYCKLITGDYVVRVLDEYPVRLAGETNILSGSDIFFRGIRTYEVEEIGSQGNEVQIDKPQDFISHGTSSYSTLSATGTGTLPTPFGIKTDLYRVSGTTKEFVLATESESVDDVININMLLQVNYFGDSVADLNLRDNDGLIIATATNPSIICTNIGAGKWHLVSWTVRCTAANSGPDTRVSIDVSSGTPQITVAGIAIKNLGQYGTFKAVQPVCIY